MLLLIDCKDKITLEASLSAALNSAEKGNKKPNGVGASSPDQWHILVKHCY